MGRIRGCWAELTIIIKSTVTAHDFHSGPSFHPTMTFLHRASRANRIKTSHDITRSAKTMLSNNFLITTIYDIYIYTSKGILFLDGISSISGFFRLKIFYLFPFGQKYHRLTSNIKSGEFFFFFFF